MKILSKSCLVCIIGKAINVQINHIFLYTLFAGQFSRIIDAINVLKDEVREVSKETQTIKTLMLKKEQVSRDPKIMSCKQLADKYSYNIPLTTVEEFERFDMALGDPNSSLREDVVGFKRFR